ncbi:MAG: hypothetical protein Q4C47_05975 [Planctomycetia bacterium]|nr:hypothetical protein [Planctomycetia bacterium]
MSAEYRGMGVAFQFPENWELEQEPSMGRGRGVTVNAPSGGFWSLAVYPRGTDPKRLADAAVAVFRQEYREVETEAIDETIEGHSLTGYDVDFFCLDILIRATIRCFGNDDSVYVILSQGEDREHRTCGAVFEAITTSLLRRLRSLRADLGEIFPDRDDRLKQRQFESALDAPPAEEISPADWADLTQN